MSDTTAAPEVAEEQPKNPYEVVRARTADGSFETSVRRVIAESGDMKILDGKTAVDGFGYPLPDKPVVNRAAPGEPVEGNQVTEPEIADPTTRTTSTKTASTKEK